MYHFCEGSVTFNQPTQTITTQTGHRGGRRNGFFGPKCRWTETHTRDEPRAVNADETKWLEEHLKFEFRKEILNGLCEEGW